MGSFSCSDGETSTIAAKTKRRIDAMAGVHTPQGRTDMEQLEDGKYVKEEEQRQQQLKEAAAGWTAKCKPLEDYGRAEEGALGNQGSAAKAKTCLVLNRSFHSWMSRGVHPDADRCATRWRPLGRQFSAMLLL